jgi:hypothetical protein
MYEVEVFCVDKIPYLILHQWLNEEAYDWFLFLLKQGIQIQNFRFSEWWILNYLRCNLVDLKKLSMFFWNIASSLHASNNLKTVQICHELLYFGAKCLAAVVGSNNLFAKWGCPILSSTPAFPKLPCSPTNLLRVCLVRRLKWAECRHTTPAVSTRHQHGFHGNASTEECVLCHPYD